MKVTVVIPNYNGMKFIRPCMDALAKQTEETTEFCVLVVDNGSTDGSLQVLQQEYDWAQLIALPENTGFCHAVNVGMEAARTPYVLLLNNDTEVLPGFMVNMLRAIEADEKIFSVSSMMLNLYKPDLIDDAGDLYNILGWASSRGKGQPKEKYETAGDIFAACGGAAIYRREAVLSLGGFDELHFAYLEDIDLGYRARIHGYRNLYEPSAQVLHAGSGTSGSRYNEFKVNLSSANNAYMIGKNMPLLQLLINFPFLLLGFLVKAAFFTLKKMGIVYVRGYGRGIARCFTREGRARKVRFHWQNLGNYVRLEWELLRNTLFIFIKS